MLLNTAIFIRRLYVLLYEIFLKMIVATQTFLGTPLFKNARSATERFDRK